MRKTIILLLLLFMLLAGACSTKKENSNSTKEKYDLIYECSNEMACYNVLKYTKYLKTERYSATMSEEEQNSFELISGHGDVCTDKGTGTIYISYSFNNNGSKIVCNESYNVVDYGISIRYSYKNCIEFKSDESVCPDVDKKLSSYINTKQVNYFFKKYQNEDLNYEKAKFKLIFKNEDGTLLGEKLIEGYGTIVTNTDINLPTKEGDKEYYYTFSHWINKNGKYYDMVAREDDVLTASFEKKNVKYSLYINYPDGTEFRKYEKKYNYNQEIYVKIGEYDSLYGEVWNSWKIMPIVDNVYFVFDGWVENELVDNIKKGYSAIYDDREPHLFDTYQLKPLTDDITLTMIFTPRSVFDYEKNSDGTYKATLYNNVLYEKSLYNGNEKIVVLPSKAIRFDSNGNKEEFGDVSVIGQYSFSLFDNGNDYPRGSNENVSIIYVPKSIKEIEEGVFYYCKGINTIIYEGSQSDWNKIIVGKNNDDFLSCDNIIFNTTLDEYTNNK